MQGANMHMLVPLCAIFAPDLSHLTCRYDTHVPAPTHRNTMMQNIQKIIAIPRDLAWMQVAAHSISQSCK
jgi:hypothetical protein